MAVRIQRGPESHLPFCTMGNGSCTGVKRPGRRLDHPTYSSADDANVLVPAYVCHGVIHTAINVL